jgi:predicted TIM-barrel fold metal-dependent hydrolase
MSERWDTIDRYMVISADMHAGAQLTEYRDYLDARWRDEFDQWALSYQSPYDDLVDATALRNWDSDYRQADLDRDGITAEVTFPNTIPPFYNTIQSFATLPSEPAEVARRHAGLQAHNRWLVDFCSRQPGRRLGIAQVFPHDIDTALAEIRWAKESGFIGGILLPAIPPNHPVAPWFDTRYEPIWSLCEDLEMPIHQHNGTGGPDVGMDQPAAAWTEQGASWVLQELRKLDSMVPALRRSAQNRTLSLFGSEAVDGLSLLPSEYFARNCYLGASFLHRSEVGDRYRIGVDKIMWGADYPHEEGTTPYSREALRATFFDVPVAECRQMFAGNAGHVYGFDLDALTPVAQRVGPTLEEIHTPLDRAPVSNSAAFGGFLAMEPH